MTRRRVRFTATARKHVRLLKQWWLENSAHPEILDHDLREAVGMLSLLPGIGSAYPAGPVSGVRRLYLDRLMSHLLAADDAAPEAGSPWEEVKQRILGKL